MITVLKKYNMHIPQNYTDFLCKNPSYENRQVDIRPMNCIDYVV